MTVTLNPAIDRTIWLDRLVPGATHRTAVERTTVGGKGVNVARTVARLGGQAIALGIAGDDQADAIEQDLRSSGVRASFQRSPGHTRVNLKLIEGDGRLTELNGSGPEVSPGHLEALERELIRTVEQDDPRVLVLSGSLPPGIDPGVYGRWIGLLCRGPIAPAAILDASGEALALGIEAGPFIVKPNRVEAEALLGRAIATPREACDAAMELAARGPRGVLLSLGAQGAVGAWDGRAESFRTGQVDYSAGSRPTTVGAGDAMVASLAVELAEVGSAAAMTADLFFAMCARAVERAAEHIAGGG